MSSAKTVTSVAVANGAAHGGTEIMTPAVPFLEVPIWVFTLLGVPTVMTIQAAIIFTTGVLSIITLVVSLFRKPKVK